MPKTTKKCYVYCLFRPWNGEPCYIGKGIEGRYKYHAWAGANHENLHLANIFKRAEELGLEVPAVIIQDGLDEETAFEYEIALIKAIGRQANGGTLANNTDGGDGVRGFVWSNEMRAAKAVEVAQRWKDPEYAARMSAMNVGNKYAVGTKLSPERLAEKAELMKGNQFRKGVPWSEEQRAKTLASRGEGWVTNQSLTVKSLWLDPAYRSQQMATRATSEAYQNRGKNYPNTETDKLRRAEARKRKKEARANANSPPGSD